jgi:sugar transferase EpsL
MKRLFDVLIAMLMLIVLAPLLALIAIAVCYKHGRPVLFCQQRPGYLGRPFTIYKFRTMTDVCDADGNVLPDGQRLTRLGETLRKFSMDELPELLNVLKGDMSLVGPRPLLNEYLPYYTHEENRRHNIRPGITGWAQINGRNHIPWQERLAMDVWYVDHQSFWLDLRILFRTVLKVFRHDGVAVDPDTVETYLNEERCNTDFNLPTSA